jgi:hypothetical protein
MYYSISNDFFRHLLLILRRDVDPSGNMRHLDGMWLLSESSTFDIHVLVYNSTSPMDLVGVVASYGNIYTLQIDIFGQMVVVLSGVDNYFTFFVARTL